MNVDEFKAWLSRNVGRGGKRPLTDGFNKSKKGSERNPSAPEYACKDVPEYHRYAENKDLRKDDDDDKQEDKTRQNQNNNGSRNARNSQGAGRLAQSVARQIIPKVALVVVGSIVIVTSYNAMKAREAQAQGTVASTSWVWNEDGTAATLSYLDKNGKVIKETPAVVTTVETPASCTKEGKKVSTATVEDVDQTYTDVFTVVLAALGHAFDEGTETVIDGNPSIVYECTRCHEQFIVTVTPGEVDPTLPPLLASWTWSNDHLSCEVELADHNGHVVRQAPADVTVTVVDATCTKDGSTTYKATIEEGEETYSTTYSETAPALGHSFDEGTETIIDGKKAIVYECTRCHEQFTIIISEDEDKGFEADFAHLFEHSHHDEVEHLVSEHHHCGRHHHLF